MPLWIRPYLIPPRHTITTFESVQSVSLATMSATAVPGQPGAWIISSGAINAAGQPVSSVPAACLPPPPTGGKQAKPASAAAMWRCMDSRGIRVSVTYQPAGRYWPLQLVETGIFLALALALAGLCFWRLGRRRT
jgi:hypothetical protein